jgi:hypothetical protein
VVLITAEKKRSPAITLKCSARHRRAAERNWLRCVGNRQDVITPINAPKYIFLESGRSTRPSHGKVRADFHLSSHICLSDWGVVGA